MPPQRVTLDLERITLGEMMDVELASGRSFMDLVRSRTGQVMVVLYLRALQQRVPGQPPPSWSELAKLTPSEAMQSVLPESADSD